MEKVKNEKMAKYCYCFGGSIYFNALVYRRKAAREGFYPGIS
jgi:hypothetical protein